MAVALTALVACTCVPPAVREDQVIQPLRDLAQQVAEQWPEEPVVTVAGSTWIHLRCTDSRNTATRRRVTWYSVNRLHPNLLESVDISEHTGTMDESRIDVQVFGQKGYRWRTGPTDIDRHRVLTQGQYWSSTFVQTVQLPRYQIGMLVRVETSQRFTRPEFLKSAYLRGTYPVGVRFIELNIPRNAPIAHSLANAESLVVHVDTVMSEDRRAFRISTTMCPKRSPNSRLKRPEEWYAGVHFSLPPYGYESLSWRQLGDYYLDLIRPSLQQTPDVSAFFDDVPDGPADSIAAGAALLLRSRVRYHADLEGLYAIVPRPAGQVVAKGYGDCKEMSMLMTMALQQHGVRANMVLIAIEGHPQPLPSIPALCDFNHMVIRYQGDDSTWRFIDPTVQHGSPTRSYYHLVGQRALVLTEGYSLLDTVASDEPVLNSVATTSTISADQSRRAWRIEGTIRVAGSIAHRASSVFAHLRNSEEAAVARAFVQEFFGFSPDVIRVNTPSADTVELLYGTDFRSNYIDMDHGGLALNIPSLFGGFPRFTTLESEGPRFYHGVRQVDTWEVPDGFSDLESHPLDHRLASGRWEVDGHTVRRTFSLDRTLVPAAERETIAGFAQTRGEFARATIWHE